MKIANRNIEFLMAYGAEMMFETVRFCSGIAGFGYYYFTGGQSLDAMTFNEIVKHVVLGGFFKFFVINSPCTRGRC